MTTDIGALLDMVFRRAPELMRTGGIVGQSTPRTGTTYSTGEHVTPKEARGFMKEKKRGKSIRTIATETGRSYDCVLRHLKRLGFVPAKRRPIGS